MDSIGVYERLGVRRVINAWGVATELGGWGQSERVTQAMEEANRGTVEMQELLRKSGDFIADLLGVEAAFVTSGGAAAQALSVAACMAGTDPDRIAQLPDTTGMKNEVVIQKRNRYMFDRCYTLTGASLDGGRGRRRHDRGRPGRGHRPEHGGGGVLHPAAHRRRYRFAGGHGRAGEVAGCDGACRRLLADIPARLFS